MTKFGKNVFHEFNFHHWIEVRKGKVLYKAYVLDENKNVIRWTPFRESFDDALECGRKLLDDIMVG